MSNYSNVKTVILQTHLIQCFRFHHIDKDEIKDYFLELNRYGETCKFRNCNHIKEPNCNVKHQLEIGILRNLDTTIIYNYLMKFQIERLDIK